MSRKIMLDFLMGHGVGVDKARFYQDGVRQYMADIVLDISRKYMETACSPTDFLIFMVRSLSGCLYYQI
jgi:hypothetical protein